MWRYPPSCLICLQSAWLSLRTSDKRRETSPGSSTLYCNTRRPPVTNFRYSRLLSLGSGSSALHLMAPKRSEEKLGMRELLRLTVEESPSRSRCLYEHDSVLDRIVMEYGFQIRPMHQGTPRHTEMKSETRKPMRMGTRKTWVERHDRGRRPTLLILWNPYVFGCRTKDENYQSIGLSSCKG